MSTPQPQSQPPHPPPSPSHQAQPPPQYPYAAPPYLPYPPQQAQQYNPNGGPGPGPSTMQMQQMLHAQMQQQQGGYPQGMQGMQMPGQGMLNPQQMAALQQMQRTGHVPGIGGGQQGQGQGMSQQQMLGQLHAQAQAAGNQGPQAQAFLAAMRNQQFQPRPPPGPPGPGPGPPGQPQSQAGQVQGQVQGQMSNQQMMQMQAARMAYMQQQQQQQQQQQPQPPHQQQPQQGTMSSPDVSRIQQQNAPGRQSSPANPSVSSGPGPGPGRSGSIARSESPRHPSHGNLPPPPGPPQQGNMPPPPLPPQSHSTPTQNGGPQLPAIPHARFNPSPSQLQAIAAEQQKATQNPGFQQMPGPQQQIQLNMIHHRMMSMFAQQSQAQAQAQSQGQGPSTPISAPSPSGSIPPNQSPYSSLPSHMAPPRPASAASQRAPSPRPPGPPPPQSPSNRNIPTPPPNQQGQGSQPYPPPPPSPSNSVHSHHPGTPQNQHHPQMQYQQQQQQQGMSSPHMAPQQRSMSITSNGEYNSSQHQQQQGNPYMPPQPPQSHPSQPMQNMQAPPQQMPPPGPAPPQPPTDSAPPGHQPTLPPRQGPTPNTSDFPFDPRLLSYLPHLQNPKWREDMQTRNPALLASASNAAMALQRGVSKDVMDRMQQWLAWMRSGAPPIQAGSVGPNGARPQAQQPLPSAGAGQGDLQRRPSGKESRPGTAGSGQGMPMAPPTWIPGQAGVPPASTPHSATPIQAAASGSMIPQPPTIPLKEWEPLLRPALPYTQITAFPPMTQSEENADPTFSGRLPALSQSDISDIQSWMAKDKAYLEGFEMKKKKVQGKMMHWAKESDMGTPWWMLRKGERQGRVPGRLTILWPQDKKGMRSRGSHRGRKEIRFTPKQLKAMANVEDHVVPVRLDIEEGQYKLKDTFMWNCSDTVVSPELFAQSLCDDFSLPNHLFVPKIIAAIQERIREYKDQVLPFQPRSDPSLARGKLEEDSPEWEVFRNMREMMLRANAEEGEEEEEEVKTDEGAKMELGGGVEVVIPDGMEEDVKPDIKVNGAKEVEVPVTIEEAMKRWKGGEGGSGSEDLRVLIKVDILVGTQNLSDTFEWDLSSPVSPEDFALLYTQELGLSGEFATALAHDIHEQILIHKRCLFLVGHTLGSSFIQDDEVRSSFLPAITSVLRREDIAMSTYTPIFTNYTEEDVALIEREREKDSKRKKRGTRARRGVLLPDREPIKTHRTLLNPLGANGLAMAKLEETPSVSVPTGGSRRAAAIAAQANINLLAQDLPIPEKAPPSPLPVSVPSRRGRGGWRGRGLSRASPASFREGSITQHHTDSNVGTPVMGPPAPLPVPVPSTLPSGMKRSYREESASETASPIPRKRQMHQGRIVDSPEPDTEVEVKPVIPDYAATSLSNGRGSIGSASGTGSTLSPEKLAAPVQQQPQTPVSAPMLKREEDDSDSSSSSDSSDDYDDSRERAIRKGRGSLSTPNNTRAVPPTSSLTPVRNPSSTPAPAVTPSQPAQYPPPVWCKRAEEQTKSRYPKDLFVVVPKPKPEGGAPDWRLKCVDCPGKVYNLGPGESFSNFEIHLKNRAHIANREKRESGG